MKQTKEPAIQNEFEETSKGYTIWINETERIVSFHPVEISVEKTFANRDYYMSFLLSLNGYRFQ